MCSLRVRFGARAATSPFCTTVALYLLKKPFYDTAEKRKVLDKSLRHYRRGTGDGSAPFSRVLFCLVSRTFSPLRYQSRRVMYLSFSVQRSEFQSSNFTVRRSAI